MLKRLDQYLLDILISLDQTINTILGGKPDNTISGRVGYYSLLGRKWAIVAEKVINKLFFWDYQHCFSSIEWDILERDGIYKRHHKIDIEKMKAQYKD